MAISDAERQRRIAERCWEVYDLLVHAFSPPTEFHLIFPEQAELALFTEALQVQLIIGDQGEILDLSEEYIFRNRDLEVSFYSYVLLRGDRQVLLRADPLPHHRVDYRNRPLENFPHHLHDSEGRIHSFEGQLKHFIERATQLLNQ